MASGHYDYKKQKKVGSLSRVAREADGWICVPPVKEFRESLIELENHAKEFGRKTPKAAMYATINVNKDERKAVAEGLEFVSDYYISEDFLKRFYDFDAYAQWGFFESTDKCIKVIEEYIDAGATHLIIRLASRDAKTQLDSFGKEVFPSF